MSRVYDIMLEHGEVGLGERADTVDTVNTAPMAVIAIWRYEKPVTYSRLKRASESLDTPETNRVRKTVLVVCDDIRTVSVSHTKSSHVGQLSASLYPGMNYLHECFPGDHVACWMVNSEELAKDLIDRIQEGEKACNGFMDGLKFLGRLASVRKNINQNPNGQRTTTYTMTAGSFTELDSSVYLDEHLAQTNPGEAVSFLKQTGLKIAELISVDSGGIGTNKILPALLGALYGKGIPKNYGERTELTATAGLDDPNAMVIPDAVAKMLGVSTGTKENGLFAYTDILEFIHGVQNFQYPIAPDILTETAFASENRNRSGAAAAKIFTPDGLSGLTASTALPDRRRFTGVKNLGVFMAIPSQFTGQRTVWSILEQYVNRTVNEMYTTLRVGPEGRVFPTVNVRQLPFSSGATENFFLKEKFTAKSKQVTVNKKIAAVGFTAANGSTQIISPERTVKQRVTKDYQEKRLVENEVKLTRFSELPRWVAHPVLIRALDVGRSDAMRCNFVHIYGETGFKNSSLTPQIIRDPPVVDMADINRSGLRPYIATVPCSDVDVRLRRSADWMFIMSDILMGQHLTLSGQVSLLGVQAPICVGDNFEFDEHIFHIESVNHNFTINPNGIKTFSTTLSLTHGQKIEQLLGDDFSIYTGVDQDDLTMADPPASVEYTLSPTPETEGRPGVEDDSE